jgi:TonB family protein
VDEAGFHTETFVASEGFTRKFEEDSFEGKLHICIQYTACARAGKREIEYRMGPGFEFTGNGRERDRFSSGLSSSTIRLYRHTEALLKGTVFLFAILGIFTTFSSMAPAMIAPQDEINIRVSLGCGGGPHHSDATETTLQHHRIFGALPHYPSAAIAANINGVVVLRTVISPEGKVADLKIIDGNPILATAARKAVKGWRYQPIVVDGTPIEVQNEVVLVFHLGEIPPVVESTPKTLCSSVGGRLIRRIDPEFPTMAKLAHIQGEVVIEAVIDKEGDIAEANATAGHPILVEAALKAVKRWKYEPFVVGGLPVPVRTMITIRFHM